MERSGCSLHWRTATLAALALGVLAGVAASPASAARTGRMSSPVLAYAGSSQASLDVSVCAGTPTGAPAGFTIQWMTAAAWAANGSSWYLPGDPRLCQASFSGDASGVRYDLLAGECVVVNVGDRLFDNGAVSNCMVPLVCSTGYVFRGFAHGAGYFQRSGYSGNRGCSNMGCGHQENCTHTQGYWKTHGPVPVGNNQNEWPVTALDLGLVNYTDLELLDIFNEPAAGNGLISLSHQLIAAKLNVAKGADATVIAGAIAEADLLIGELVVPPVGIGFLEPSATGALTDLLASYNEGLIGPGNCDETCPHCGGHHCGHCGGGGHHCGPR